MIKMHKFLLIAAVLAGFALLAGMQPATAEAAVKKVYVTKHKTNVYPSLAVMERYADVLAFKPKKAKKFKRRHDVLTVTKGTRMTPIYSVISERADGVVYKVHIPSLGKVGYVVGRNVKKIKPKHVHKHKPSVIIVDIL